MTQRLAQNFCFGRIMALVAASSAPIALLRAQSPAARQQFDVASVKPSKPETRGGGYHLPPGGERLTVTNLPVKMLLVIAYNVGTQQVSGGPTWINSEGYDIEAKAEHPASNGQMLGMLQNLLVERFKLILRRETRQLPVYILVLDKAGSKLRESKEEGEPMISRGAKGQAIGRNVPMSLLTQFLGSRAGRPVLDKTGLTANYNFELDFATDVSAPESPDSPPPPDPSGPSFFTALRQQLGLRLEAQTGPVEFVIIDRAEKPAEN